MPLGYDGMGNGINTSTSRRSSGQERDTPVLRKERTIGGYGGTHGSLDDVGDIIIVTISSNRLRLVLW